MSYYIVNNKPDDYDNCKRELVNTEPAFAKQYYNYKEVDEADVEVLKKYLDFVDIEEEQERTAGERFYGNDE